MKNKAIYSVILDDPIKSAASAKWHKLPLSAERILSSFEIPPRLLAHHIVVHDAAKVMQGEIERLWPDLKCDFDEVLFGASLHDIGKIECRDELTGPGGKHAPAGPPMLEGRGVPPGSARFAFTHSCKDDSDATLTIEDRLVALASTCWGGRRHASLEKVVTDLIADLLCISRYDSIDGLEAIIEIVGERGKERLAWQNQFPIDAETS